MANFPGTAGNDTYAGTAQDDTISDGGGGSDSLAGAGGNDIISVSGGVDTVDGGTGADRLVVAFGAGVGAGTTISFSGDLATGYTGYLDGSGASDVSFTGIENFSVTWLGAGTANLTTGAGRDSLTGGAGADILNSGGGVDTINGGAGLDVWSSNFAGESADLAINLGLVSSFLSSGSVANIEAFGSLIGGAGDDSFTSTALTTFAESVNGGAGDDVITLFGKNVDTVAGGAGTDLMSITWDGTVGSISTASFAGTLAAGYDGYYDGAGADDVNFSGIERFDLEYGGTGSVSLTTGDGADTLTGGGLNDSLRSGGGADDINGGGGLDNWGGDKSAATASIVIDLNTTSAYLGTGSVANVEGFNTLITGSGNDQLTSTAAAVFAESVNGGAGDDVITLFGKNVDTVTGGAGTDLMSITWDSTVGSISTASFAAATPTGFDGYYDGAGADDVNFSGIERFDLEYGGTGSVSLTTGDGPDTLTGGGLNDSLRSGAGADDIDGGGGLDNWGGDKSAATASIVIDLNTTSTYLGTGSVTNVEGFNTLITGSGNDQLTSTAAAVFAENVNGGAGDDVITLFGKNVDTVAGGAGADLMSITWDGTVGSISTASFAGTLAAGYDGYYDGAGADDVNFSGIERFDLEYGGTGSVSLTTGDGADTLTGGGLNDSLRSGAGADDIDGGGGLDNWGGDKSAATASIVIDLNTTSTYLGSGSVTNVEGFNTLITGSGNDQLTSTAAAVFAESVNGGAGDDVITLFGKNVDTVAGGAGTDLMSITWDGTVGSISTVSFAGTLAAGYDGYYDGAGADDVNFSGIERFDLQYGGTGSISLTVGDGDDRVIGGAQNDNVAGAGGSDTLSGGTGNDTVSGGVGAGVDLLIVNYATAATAVSTTGLTLGANGYSGVVGNGTAAFRTSFSEIERFSITGGSAADSLLGGNSSDTLEGGAGDDRLDGQAGTDTASYASATAAVTVSLDVGTGAQNTGGAGLDRLFSIELLTGSAFADLLTGNAGANRLTGNDGGDTLSGGAGDDTLDGGAGDDSLVGGADLDTATYASATAGVTVALGVAAPQATGGAGTDSLSDVERLTGSNFNDRLTGAGGSETLNAGDGADTVTGGLGDDDLDGGQGVDTASYASASTAVIVSLALDGVAQATGGGGTDTLDGVENLTGGKGSDTLTGDEGANELRGGKGRDVLVGGAGNDKLLGEAKADTLTGGAGKDNLTGGADADRFVYTAVTDSTSAPSGRDVISAFDEAGGDLIDLAQIDANLAVGGNQSFVLVGSPSGAAGELWLTFDASMAIVRADVDGGGADFSIEVETGVALTATAFVL